MISIDDVRAAAAVATDVDHRLALGLAVGERDGRRLVELSAGVGAQTHSGEPGRTVFRVMLPLQPSQATR